jgi:peptide/nickel transport system permease protein
MSRLLLYKLLSALIALFLSSVIVFTLVRLAPGDPVKILLGGVGDIPITKTEAYEKRVAELRAELGLDDGVMVQYGHWLSRVVRFDFGTSIVTKRSVKEEIGRRLPATIVLSAAAVVVQTLAGLILGIISAVYAGRFADEAARGGCVLVASIPGFVLGLMGLYLFGVNSSMFRVGADAGFDRLWLPAMTLGLIGVPQLTRIVRANLLDQFGECYVLSSISRGLPRRYIVRGALRNAMRPIVTMIALTLTSLLGGSVVIENIFAWPGIGTYAMESVLNHDYPVIQAYALLMVSIVILVNLFVDAVYLLSSASGEVRRRPERRPGDE